MENPAPITLTSIGLNMLAWISDLPMKDFMFPLVIVSFIRTMSSGCIPAGTPTALPIVFNVKSESPAGVLQCGPYRNLFQEYLNESDADAWEQLFYGNDNSERVYYLVDEDMAY
jgi:hypothetical protein